MKLLHLQNLPKYN